MMPIVLLGMITAIKEYLNATAAEMIYGTGIRLPAEFFLPTNRQTNSEYANRLKELMEKVRPQPITRHGEKKIFVFRELESLPCVFLRYNAIRGPLKPPYNGPFKVTQRGEKAYAIKVNNRDVTTSVDLLKPAFVVPDHLEEKTAEIRIVLIPVEHTNARNESGATIYNRNNEGNTNKRYVAWSGRGVRFPD